MSDLLTELTATTAGSRDLSNRVLLALGWTKHPKGDPRTVWRLPNGEPILLAYPNHFGAPDPTRNLQDAVDLVQEYQNRTFYMHFGGLGQPHASWEGGIYASVGNTLALAVCRAILKHHDAQT